jgi:hypothetical protein
MTTASRPDDNAEGAAKRHRTRRRLALAGVLALIVVAALLTPELIGGRSGDARLTTYSAQAQGARLLYELAGRLGWRVERWTDGGAITADPRTVIALLDPVQPLGAIEAHNVLERVRAGSALLYVMSGSSGLDDSLHIKRSLFGGMYQSTAAGTADAPRAASASDTLKARRFDSTASDTASADEEETESPAECAHTTPNGGALPMWGDQTVRLWRLQWSRPRPPSTVIFARSASEQQPRDTTSPRSAPAAAGFPVGRGRVVVLADPDLLRNDVLRVCRWGLDIVAARMLDYLATGEPRRNRLVFDEYHQGFGAHPGTLRAIALYLSRAPSGHVLLQALLGGLVLLLALGPRALPVRDAERVERRSPLEHVSALAQAYARVSGTRTATAQLLRGVRRRVERGVRPDAGSIAESDARFLDMAARTPTLAEDVALIRRALVDPLTRREFESVGGALQRLEQSLLTQRR